MILIQLTGLSASGKSTIASGVNKILVNDGYRSEVIDGDAYRKILCKDLGFSKEDRNENIRRLGFVANLLATNGVIAIIAAINPYEEIRQEISSYGSHVKLVWINCDIDTLIKRDSKGLYKKASLSDNHPDKINNLSGINDPFEIPENPHLIINTNIETEKESIKKLYDFISREVAIDKNNSDE
jgi:adenylylsulfate kinase